MKKLIKLLISTVLVSPIGSRGFCFAQQAGTIDLSFNIYGQVATTIGSGMSGGRVVVQPDGKIIIGGMMSYSITTGGMFPMTFYYSDFKFVRYNQNGSLDNTFGTSGIATVSLSTGFGNYGAFDNLALQSDGKIVAVGVVNSIGIIIRINTNGTLDNTFSGDGILRNTDLTTLTPVNQFKDVAIQTNGKIVVCGATSSDFAVFRVNADGAALDFSFDSDGLQTTNLGATDTPTALAIQSDGKIVLTGNTNSFSSVYVVRYTSTGALDTSFDTDGIQIMAFPFGGSSYSILIQSDGKILIGAISGVQYGMVTSAEFTLVRYNTNGSLDLTLDGDGIVTDYGSTNINIVIARYLADGSDLDATFGVGGKTIVDLTGTVDNVTCLALHPNGTILVGGNTVIGANTQFILARFSASGGYIGTTNTNVITGVNIARAIAIQTDGKILLAGQVGNDFAVIRYNSLGTILDNTFDGDGMQTTTFGASSTDEGYAMVIQPDGKILVSGNSNVNSTPDFALVQYNTNGSIDNSFGTSGKALVNFGGSDFFPAVALTPSGKIMLAGQSSVTSFGMARFNANGTLDTGFDTDGKLEIPIGNSRDVCTSMVIQSDGRVLAAGYYDNGLNLDFALIRVNTVNDFTVNNGKMTTSFGAYDNEAYTMAEQTDGKIILGGYAENTSNGVNGNLATFALTRHNTDGSLDNTFDSDGKVTTTFQGFEDFITAIALQTDGKIIAAGHSYSLTEPSFALARYTTTGSLDNTFGTVGKVITGMTNNYYQLSAIALQSDGKIIVGGSSKVIGNSDDFTLFRYNTNGTLDNTFGTNGLVTTTFSTSFDIITSLIIQADGKIIAGGYTRSGGTNYDFAIARYSNAALPNPQIGKSTTATNQISSPANVTYQITQTALFSPGFEVTANGGFRT